MALRGIGIDLEKVNRFLPLAKDRHSPFLEKNFSQEELEYCFSFSDPAMHLAGTFAAKEAVFKSIGDREIVPSSIEIRREKTGKPVVWIHSSLQIEIEISISHTEEDAVAVAIRQ